MTDKFTELIAMKKSRKKPQEGDIFVIQPKENHYYFGKVIKTNIQGKNLNFEGMNLIFMYNCLSHNKEIPRNLDEFEFLFAPTVVNFQGWLKGYFETVGNQPLTVKELNVDYGFYDDPERQDRFYNLEGERILHKPKYLDFVGLASYGYVGRQAYRVLYGKEY
ncbi:immunity 26/phosphotriesterase HocA family protein [Paenibacillus ihumii]|uniref:immunity 26/phosphotriesterase HocA family protein n=1 Tax=Paenibacillus ihumii TaxID=687436 RepID=UPI0006D7E026|nr:immunity 26/phosphotriesterase HocA family protein [Paenibacillus ihumii]